MSHSPMTVFVLDAIMPIRPRMFVGRLLNSIGLVPSTICEANGSCMIKHFIQLI